MNNILHLTSMVDAYEHPKDYLLDELIILDVLLEYEMQRMLATEEEAVSVDAFRGMYFSVSEAKALLDKDEPFLQLTSEQDLLLHQLKTRVAARLQKSRLEQASLPIELLKTGFRLNELDIRLLIVAIAPHVNRKYLKLYAYLQDDMTSQHLTLDLMLRLCCTTLAERKYAYEIMTSPNSHMKGFFTSYTNLNDLKHFSLLMEPIRLEPRLINFLLGIEWRYDGALASLKHYSCANHKELPSLLINEDIHTHMQKYIADRDSRMTSILWVLQGPTGSGKTFHARHISKILKRSLLEFDLSHAPEQQEAFRQVIDQVLLEAALIDAIPAFDRIHTLQSTQGLTTGNDRRKQWLFERLLDWTGIVFLFSEEPVKSSIRMPDKTWVNIVIPLPDLEQSQKLWEQLTQKSWLVTANEISQLAGKFRFTPGQMITTVEEARKLEKWEDSAAFRPQTAGNPSKLLHQSAYQLTNHQLQNKAAKVESKFRWEDLILPNDTLQLLRQACNRIKHRHTVMHHWGFDRVLPYGRGISMMFTGPPGTGKTMSALVMAKEMEAELYRVDLSRVVSKYIGETEKNLSEIFDQAKLSGAILFFDEADALFGKRSEVKDAHDKYANMETSFLLQKMEEYDGLTILATNFAQNLDDAFTRRIQFIIKYPFPSAEQREQLWRSAIPPQVPSEEIDYAFLSQTFELAGGSIKNVILTAAYLAVSEGTSLAMKHMIESVIQEYKKTGKLLLKDRLGPYAEYWKG
ncbi:ATP-binding protein [Paenibacillus paridis]|uniref:ATP-binding protein n=1 Tax=Paenibacillus paridis TaxID=2583376 RepID=UPI00111E23CB|nr:AAA family ATPase [Paenibacillus paridis]